MTKYNLKVKNKFKALDEIEEVEELWQQLKRSITEAAEEEIPTKERKTKQKWMTEDILNLMDKRRKAKGEQGEYESIHREVRRKCEEAKEAWLNEKCQEIVKLQRQAPNTMYKNTNEEVLKETESTRSLMNKIRRRQAKFVGHIMRREGLENLDTTGRMEGKKSRGRQREKMLDGMTSWMGTKRVTDILSESWDRESWKDMIANAKGQGT
ncbi:endonuclease-reverse transcriptase [Plakobranchus ocellatus]|uniref:Endonuclease-reverse transcriptase n=1 Tax=Plakobranchus ocellatus TaxID=259542 RepID=A0AAV4AR86_9GAST|nr:endonuclease-reverse transcriptase [Plakobranchus ocellatus]